MHYANNQIPINLQQILSPDNLTPVFDYLIICNSQLSQPILVNLLPKVSNILLVDGGANRFYASSARDCKKVEGIIGDLDSVSLQVVSYYSSMGCRIMKIEDEDSNDLQKALAYVVDKKSSKIGLMGLGGGRIDQELYNLHVLHKYSYLSDIQFIVFNYSSIIVVIRPSLNYAITTHSLCLNNQVGLIAFGRARVQTKGFKWNIGQKHGISELQWGKLISSSNVIQEQRVQIISSETILLTIELMKPQ